MPGTWAKLNTHTCGNETGLSPRATPSHSPLTPASEARRAMSPLNNDDGLLKTLAISLPSPLLSPLAHSQQNPDSTLLTVNLHTDLLSNVLKLGTGFIPMSASSPTWSCLIGTESLLLQSCHRPAEVLALLSTLMIAAMKLKYTCSLEGKPWKT